MGVYYLSPTGSDATGDGSLAKPWKGIQKGLNSITAGDTLRLLDGIYDEGLADIRVNCKGTVANPIVIEGWPNAIITGALSLSITDLACATSSKTVTSPSGKFTVEMEGATLWISGGTHFVTGYYVVDAFVSATEMTLTVSPNDKLGNATGGLAKIVSTTSPGARNIFQSPDNGTAVTYITWRNLTLNNVAYAWKLMYGAEHCTWDHITITRSLRALYLMGGCDLTFTYCDLSNNVTGLQLGPNAGVGIAGILVEDSSFIDNDYRSITSPPLPPKFCGVTNTDGVTIDTTCSDITIRRCIACGQADGFDVKPWCTIDRCFASGNFDNGFKTWDEDWTLTGNDNPCGKTVLTNCVAVLTGSGFNVGIEGDGSVGTGFTFCGGKMYNCTAVMNGRSEIRFNGPYALTEVWNSVFWCQSITARSYRNTTQAGDDEYPAGGYNCWWRVVAPGAVGEDTWIFKCHKDSAYYDHQALSELVAGTSLGCIVGGTPTAGCPGTIWDHDTCIFVDPDLVDDAVPDCHPNLASPLHGAGLYSASITKDYDGETRLPADPVIGGYVGQYAPGVGPVNWTVPGIWWLNWWRPIVGEAPHLPAGLLRLFRTSFPTLDELEEWWWKTAPGYVTILVPGPAAIFTVATLRPVFTDVTTRDTPDDDTTRPNMEAVSER